jgi:phosphatidylserine/phosphatidylglycerophosphate/cardiolipin synthase-like enzyme
MRFTQPAGDFSAKVITGTHTILMAIDCKEERRKGLLGFAFKREIVGSGQPAKWLRSLKVFRSIVPDPKNTHDPTDPKKHKAFYTNEFPVQSFLWGDYAASPGTKYRLNIMPMYGKPGALTTDKKDEIDIEIETETEWKPGETHGVWFNRGAIAGQKFAEEFGNKEPDDIENPNDPTVLWLSRGLLKACLDYINSTPPGDALRVAAYEFTYLPILKALKERLDHGVDVQIVYHDTTDADGGNEKAMEKAGLPINDQKITYRRSKTKIPHNKFIVRLKGGKDPVEVWTGSTNFTSSGFLGQTNVGHRVADPETARQYFDYWLAVKPDPERDDLRKKTAALTPNPLEVISAKSIVRLFSPRAKAELLGWYGRRMLNAANSVWFTAAFGVSPVLIEPIAKRRDQMRFILMEKPAPDAARKKLTQDISRVILSYGVPLGQLYRMKNGKPTARKPIREFELDKWFLKEEHYRAKNDGFVFFVHTKFLLIDPLSDDPLVCSGSANFSSNSLLQNDENMLLVRGNTRVADIYMTEFDRVFRHFYFRDIANELADKGDDAKSIFLDETDKWTDAYFAPGRQKTNRRLMFFAPHAPTWSENAAAGSGKPSGSTGKTKAKPKRTKRAKKTARRPAGRKAVKKTKRTKTRAAKKTKRKTARKKTAKRKTRTKGRRKTARKTKR